MGKTNFDIVEANLFVGPNGPISGGGLATGVIGTGISMPDATATASTETVDPAEFAAVVALVNACKAKLNSILVTE